ncbi:alpha-ketoglutarate-dependent dioxygenase AlkB family protein [Flavobacterium sp.]|uniref:alpha-ketoglutarate-dependent dioxygenase AlkB family protein n=1 Tax=Flavobacterium sp. TaxID=239 RepID=UPI003B9CC94D
MLFAPDPIHFDIPDGELVYIPGFIGQEECVTLFEQLLHETLWQSDPIRIFGKIYQQPRLTALYGNEGKPYGYSGIVMQPNRWTPLLTHLKERVEQRAENSFSTVLLNLYRNGADSNGWHADNESALGRNPVIASLSFGASRKFQLKHNTLSDQRINLELEDGSLLLMKGSMQHFWKHQIPKTTKEVGPRINLTFRELK